MLFIQAKRILLTTNRLGYSKKGWTNGEIGVAWIEEFDKYMSAKAAGRYRLLIVDGHNSHYTYGFLIYARTHQILVLCYPSHTTHVLQGLDVVVFAILKRCLSEERDLWERETGETISKTNFLTIYGQAHLQAMPPKTIRTAFRKTGIWPFDPSIITKEMMAPSKVTSCEGHLPIPPPTPVCTLARMMCMLAIGDHSRADRVSGVDEGSDGEVDASGETANKAEDQVNEAESDQDGDSGSAVKADNEGNNKGDTESESAGGPRTGDGRGLDGGMAGDK